MNITTINLSGFLSAQMRITLNDLECPIQLKVRFTDVRLLRVSDSTVRIGVARGGRGSGLEGSGQLPTPCGQLTRCFSAVAELIVVCCCRKIAELEDELKAVGSNMKSLEIAEQEVYFIVYVLFLAYIPN